MSRLTTTPPCVRFTLFAAHNFERYMCNATLPVYLSHTRSLASQNRMQQMPHTVQLYDCRERTVIALNTGNCSLILRLESTWSLLRKRVESTEFDQKKKSTKFRWPLSAHHLTTRSSRSVAHICWVIAEKTPHGWRGYEHFGYNCVSCQMFRTW